MGRGTALTVLYLRFLCTVPHFTETLFEVPAKESVEEWICTAVKVTQTHCKVKYEAIKPLLPKARYKHHYSSPYIKRPPTHEEGEHYEKH